MEKKRVRVQSGEDQSSVRACYSQDGRWMFVCAGSAVKVYSTISHELVHILSHHEEEITSCCINPTNTMQLLTASQDGKVILWDYVDGSLLREIEFGVPLFELALRPGKQEPSVFFQIERDSMEVDPNEGLELEVTGTAHKVVVGLTSDVILHRTPAVSPGNQLAQATEYLELGIKPSEICFSFDGEFVLSFVGKTLVVCNIVKQRLRSFMTSRHISAIACHPSELCIATGNQRGEIELWWGWNRRTKRPVTTVLHWHAHAVADLCFTSDGTYLLSGGEECVLVVWQLASCKSHYRPRLGAQITRIACAPSDQSFAVSLQNNVIQVVSGLDDSVEWSVGGMRRAHTQDPKENGMKTGLIWDPRSRGIVANSNPGSLQWYRPDVDLVTSQLDVTGLNYVSRRNDLFVLMTVEHAAFSADGRWLATVEWRDDGKTTPELRLKFWQFNHSTQEFTLNTCIDLPHNKKVTSLVFQPLPPVTKQTRTAGNLSEPKEPPPLPVPLSVSTSEDGKFKSWVLVDGEQKTEEKGREASWACRSVGYYHSLPCRGACFSEDGSLLAVNFEKVSSFSLCQV
jgi:NET1-associated nuclear protein 1 (U3 small nucleolar RNA-associated protein 17)